MSGTRTWVTGLALGVALSGGSTLGGGFAAPQGILPGQAERLDGSAGLIPGVTRSKVPRARMNGVSRGQQRDGGMLIPTNWDQVFIPIPTEYKLVVVPAGTESSLPDKPRGQQNSLMQVKAPGTEGVSPALSVARPDPP